MPKIYAYNEHEHNEHNGSGLLHSIPHPWIIHIKLDLVVGYWPKIHVSWIF